MLSDQCRIHVFLGPVAGAAAATGLVAVAAAATVVAAIAGTGAAIASTGAAIASTGAAAVALRIQFGCGDARVSQWSSSVLCPRYYNILRDTKYCF